MIKEIKNKYHNKLFILFSILCLAIIICPFFNVLKSGTQKLNYIYNDGELADGLIVIVLKLNRFNKYTITIKTITINPSANSPSL